MNNNMNWRAMFVSVRNEFEFHIVEHQHAWVLSIVEKIASDEAVIAQLPFMSLAEAQAFAESWKPKD
jgi:hypothetical protein